MALTMTVSLFPFSQLPAELTTLGTIYSPRNSTPDDRKAEASVREFRMDACRASLGWGEFLKTILKIAVWLGLARGAAAVHLFCDVVRAFTLKMPTQSTPCDRITLLYRFTALRISCEGIESGLATPFAYDDNELSDKNSDYFTDVESSVHSDHDLDINSNCDSAFMGYFRPSTSGSQKLPHIHHRSRISQGQIKTYHDRDVLETLSQASTERTLSSKTVPEKPAVPLQLVSLVRTHMHILSSLANTIPSSISEPCQTNRRR